MTVPATSAIGGPYTGNGIQTEFAFPFQIDASTDVDVWINNGTTSAVISASLYTVTFTESVVGGLITLDTALADTYLLSVVRHSEFNQLTSLEVGEDFYPPTIEQMSDDIVYQTQELDQRIKQVITFDPTITDSAQLYTQLNDAVIAAELAETGAEAAEDGAETAQTAAELAETNAEASAVAAEAAIKFIVPQWDATHTYGDNEQVAGTDGFLYVSQQGSNINHDPVGDDGTWWLEYIFNDNQGAKTTNGYQRVAGGIIIQWGRVLKPSSGLQVVIFPIAFPTACFTAQVSMENTSGIANPEYFDSFTTTTLTLSNANFGHYENWIAIGY